MNRSVHSFLFSGIMLAFSLSASAQNITLESTKNVDDFTKTTKIDVVPKGEILKGKKVTKQTAYLEAQKTIYEAAAIGTMTYFKNKDGNELYYLNIAKSVDLGCMSQYDGKAMLMFEDEEVIEIKQISETDCGDFVNVRYILVSKEVYDGTTTETGMTNFLNAQNKTLQLLETKKLKKIRIYGSKYYDDIEIIPDLQNIFQRMVDELYKQLE